MTRARFTAIAAALLALGLLPGPARALTFYDGTFAPGDWSATVLSGAPGMTESYTQETTGGNLGSWRRMVNDLPSGGSFAIFHAYTAASFDPSTIPAGSSVLIEYQEDNRRDDGGTYSLQLALEQDGIVYVAGPPSAGSGFFVWNNNTKGPYAPTQFERWDLGPAEYPDFSPSGSPIHFGYLRKGNWSAITFDLGIDNWEVTVTTVPLGTVIRQQKFSDTTGTSFDDNDRFGECVAYLGDVDGNGIGDLATSTLDDDAGADAGAAWVLRMDRDPITQRDEAPNVVKIRDGLGDFWPLQQGPGDRFGQCGDGIGDLNGDGVPDLAVGSEQAGEGVVWILFLRSNGTVRAERRIASGAWGFPTGVVAPGEHFGRDIARLGDVDGDGVVDIAVGAQLHADDGVVPGGVFILFLERDGYVKGYQEITRSTVPSLGLDHDDRFGLGVTGPGDIDGDGIPDLVAGALLDDDAGSGAGAAYVLLLNADGTVKSHTKLGDAAVGGGLDADDRFGIGLTGTGDLDGDGVPDLAVGAYRDDDGGSNQGAAYLILLNADGSAKGFHKISATAGGFTGPLDPGDELGIDLESWVGEGGQRKLAIGARSDDDGGTNRGALYILDIAALSGGAVCGDFLREKDEACDDGNNMPGDGCNATCEVEQALFLSGTAAGGNVTATVDGLPVVAPTTPGQSAEDVLTDLAAAINADGGLMALGRTAVARDQALFVDGIASLASGDGGLNAGERDDLDLVDSRLDVTFWVPDIVAGSQSKRLALTQGVAPPQDILAHSDGSLTLPSSLPLTGSYSTFVSSAATTLVVELDVSGVPLGSCGPDNFVDRSVQLTDILGGVQNAGAALASGLQCRPGGFIGDQRVAVGSLNALLPKLPLGFGSPGTLWGGTSYQAAGVPWGSQTALAGLTALSTSGVIGRATHGLNARTPGGAGALNLVMPTAVLRGANGQFFTGFGRSNLVFSRVRLRFVPEPATGLSLTSAALFLGLLGRRRRRSADRVLVRLP